MSSQLTTSQMEQIQIIMKHLNKMEEELVDYREDMENYDETLCAGIEHPINLTDLEGNDLGFELQYPVCDYNLVAKETS
jgi:hypothetical protein